MSGHNQTFSHVIVQCPPGGWTVEGRTMTASHLHSLLDGLPECVPEGLTYLAPPKWGGCWDYNDRTMTPQHAAWIVTGHVKGMMPSLLGSGRLPHAEAPASVCCWAEAGSVDNFFYAPTELEAVLAAYRASKQLPVPPAANTASGETTPKIHGGG